MSRPRLPSSIFSNAILAGAREVPLTGERAQTRARRRGLLRTLVGRYLPAELVGSAAALVALLATTGVGHGLAAGIVAATWAEAAAFYAFVTLRELRNAPRHRPWPATTLAAARNVASEFGLAEAVDVLVLRPLLMLLCVQAIGSTVLGAITGKVAADLVFYALAAPAYLLRTRGRV